MVECLENNLAQLNDICYKVRISNIMMDKKNLDINCFEGNLKERNLY